MSNLYTLKNKCHNNIDGFCNRRDMSNDYKNKRIGQAIDYMSAAMETFKDDRGRCHAMKDGNGYRKGQFVPCEMSRTGASRERVGQAYGSRGRQGSRGQSQGYQGDFSKDDRGRCHAQQDMAGYRKGQFIPCPDQ